MGVLTNQSLVDSHARIHAELIAFLRQHCPARGHCRGFRAVWLWDGGHQAHLVLARPVGITAAEPWYLVSNLAPSLDLVWAYEQRFCCEQLFRDQKAGIF